MLQQSALVAVAILAAAVPPDCSGILPGGGGTGGTGPIKEVVLNGLSRVNGLSTRNGITFANGLSTRNGITFANGLSRINGLSTRNGVTLANGLSVDCTGKELGVSCTGAPDGLMNADTGLLRADYAEVARYVVRCALPNNDAIRVLDHTGALVTLNGSIGLAPQWKTDSCDTDCQELVSACLAALTNGSGEHILIEMRSPHAAIGPSGTFPLQEAAFYGNMFTDPPVVAFCLGWQFEGIAGVNWIAPAQRACSGYPPTFGGCPYQLAGNCMHPQYVAAGAPTCAYDLFSQAATACSTPTDESWLNYNNNDRKWKNVITTYRRSYTD
jgi:hypothetical protein